MFDHCDYFRARCRIAGILHLNHHGHIEYCIHPEFLDIFESVTSAIIKTLQPQFIAIFEDTKLDKRRFGSLILVEWPAETKCTWIRYAVFLHLPKPFTRCRPA